MRFGNRLRRLIRVAVQRAFAFGVQHSLYADMIRERLTYALVLFEYVELTKRGRDGVSRAWNKRNDSMLLNRVCSSLFVT